MEIKIGKTSGFCYGVKNAVQKSEEELLKTNGEVYCLGELVHNKEVTEALKNKGLNFVENIDEASGKLIIRAHGVPKQIYEKAKKRNIELVDLTCPNVLKIHDIAKEYCQKDYYIFLIGKKQHPEIIGTASFCGKNHKVISQKEEIKEAIKAVKKSKIKHVLIIAQTTYNMKTFEEIVEEIQNKVPKNIDIIVKNTICLATELRQKETEKISKEVELMIIVGGKNSSNTNKLYDITCENCENVIFAENKDDIDIEKISKFQKIGIMAGASTPNKSVEDIIKALNDVVLV